MTEARKVNLVKDSIPRSQINPVKASGDVGKPQAKHKNKIPKALRYDLENALVGLCDVWFEEIKPYLERNNIKLHVHGTEAGRGDPEASECSHLDPGRPDRRQPLSASYAGCCSTRQTVSRARSPKPPQHPASSPRRETATERPCPNSPKEQKKRPGRRQKTLSQSPSRLVVPRLCRTYSIPPYNALKQSCVPNNCGVSHKLLQRSILRQPSPIRKKFTDVSTQTDRKIVVRVCRKEKVVNTQPQERPARPQFLSIQKCQVKADEPNIVNKQPRSLSPQFGKCQATTSFFPPKTKNTEQVLFQDDLIDIIREKHDKKLKLLYMSPIQEENPSIMNLYSPTTNRLTSKRPNKTPQWR